MSMSITIFLNRLFLIFENYFTIKIGFGTWNVKYFMELYYLILKIFNKTAYFTNPALV